jgi:hypothetical protein
MKKLLFIMSLFFWIGELAIAQQSTIPAPRDARGNTLSHGLGSSYSSELSVDVTAYNISDSYQVPSSGNDALRAFRHIYVLNQSADRTVFVCFGDSSGCTTDAMIVFPEIGLIFEPVLFGAAVGKEYIYFKLDSAGTADIHLAVW